MDKIMLMMALINPSFVTAATTDCRALHDWHHCLWVRYADGSWPDTRETCHKFQTDLASFSNPSEASILKAKLRPHVSYWVGIQLRPPLSDPIWLDGIRETDSTRFPILDGASPGKTGVYCGCVQLADHGSLEWGLDDCTYSKPFICERTVREDNKTTKHTAATSQHTSSYTPTITQGTAATKTTDTPPPPAQLASSSSTTSTITVTGNPTLSTTATGNPTSAITVTGNPTSAITVTGNPTSARYPNALTLPTHMTMTTAHPQTHHVTQHTTTPDVVSVITVTSGTTHKPHQPQLQMRPRSRKRRRLPAHIHLLLPAHVRIRRTRHCHPDSLHVHAQACCFNGASLSCVTSSRLIFACPPPYPRCIAASHNPVTSTQAVAHAQTLTTTNTFSAATTALHSTSPTGTPSATHVNRMQSTMTPKRRVSSTFLSPAFQGNIHFDQNEGLALCSESDQPLDCLLVHIQDGDLKPKVTYHALLRLFRDLRISMTISHSQQTKTNFENFFRILNFFIEGSYSQHWNKYNMSLCDVISIVEVFLNRNIQHLPLSDVISRTYSHIEILIKRIPRKMMKHFHYRDKNGLGNITHIRPTAPLNTSFNDDVVVAIVLMKVPVLQVALVDSNDSGLVLSPVLSLTAYSRERHVSLTHTFNLLHTKSGDQFRVLEMEEGGHPMQCVFWDNSSRAWSTYGCTMTSSNNLTSQCYCNHTTNFAILMQINDFELAASDKLALEVITYIGCSVALITQVFAITVYTFVGSLNTERVYMYVHRNLCIAIVCAQVTFLAGIDAVQHRLVCAAVALVLHYCYTAVFVWMLVEGLHLYSKVVQVFGTERSRMIYYMTFGWGVPVILVTISAAADWEGYGTEHSCWLSTSRKTIWTFVGPALAIIIVNMVILAVVIRIVISSSKLEKHGEYDHIRAGIKGALFLLPLLGLTWVFGLAAVNQRLVVFQYLFAIFNSLQGFFIAMFHCAFNGEASIVITIIIYHIL
ncbi:uncharacterized protein LOC124121166 [Haliotis rufescens]|uniref:uncharacterized protein LOC124121166 n=1 Tax=Haliotis rufescens TaxID=6454 RepID=UPI00201FA7F6|nr:uncharacterized protein LOC124121166 [Haliotis rufescens]